MLTTAEKNDLYAIIVASLGEDAAIRANTGGFNELTVEVVEQALTEQAKCNQSMKQLVIGLLNGSSRAGFARIFKNSPRLWATKR